MVMDIPEFNTNMSVTVVMNGINENWQNSYFRLNGTSDTLIPSARKVQSNILPQTLCATILNNSEIVACGLCVIEHNYAGLYDIVVSPQHRQKGYGQDICISLLSNAAKLGATKAYLQVVADNKKAINLYTKLGFKDSYEYWYRAKYL